MSANKTANGHFFGVVWANLKQILIIAIILAISLGVSIATKWHWGLLFLAGCIALFIVYAVVLYIFRPLIERRRIRREKEYQKIQDEFHNYKAASDEVLERRLKILCTFKTIVSFSQVLEFACRSPHHLNKIIQLVNSEKVRMGEGEIPEVIEE